MSRGAARVEGLEVRRVDVGGHEIAYLDVGSGDPLLLVPGYTGSKEDFGPVLAPLAAAGFRVVALDLRGQLDSPGHGGPHEHAPDGLADDVLALLDALELAPAHVVGHSYGGLVCRAAAIRSPGAFRSLTLMSSGPAAVGGARATLMHRLREHLVEGGVAKIAAILRSVDSDAFDVERTERHDHDALLGMGDALLAEPDRVAELAAALAPAGVPVLVLCGADDDAWSPAVQREMAQRLQALFVEIPHAAHSPAIEAPAETVHQLVGFLR